MKISVIGAGAWGTSLAIHFTRSEHIVTLYARNNNDAQELIQDGENKRFLPNFSLPENLTIRALDENNTFATQDLILVVTPTGALREVSEKWIKPYAANIPVLAACKGFEPNTGLLPHQVITEILPDNKNIGLLSGPSFAQELAKGLPCAVCLASENQTWIDDLANKLNNQTMRLYANHDPIGVAVGGAVKNVVAIATGVSDGLEYGLNARAALITRGLAEISRLALALGGKPATMMGLAGMGDLILTCTGSLSRNRQVGLKLAQDKSLNQILAELGHVAEGVNTINEVVRQANKYQIEMPITFVLQSLLDGKLKARDAVEQLMLREPKSE